MAEDVKMHEVTDLRKLIKMFYAGHGTFFFINVERNNKFQLKFKRNRNMVRNLYYSDVHVCFNGGLYFHLGRYNFKYQIIQLSDETNGYNYERLKLFLDSFKYVRDRIISGAGFPANYRVFYDGHCCRCGHMLFHPESLKAGIGPECDFVFDLDNPNFQLQIPV